MCTVLVFEKVRENGFFFFFLGCPKKKKCLSGLKCSVVLKIFIIDKIE